MTFRYSVGLQNVGSYQVSGRPFLKDLNLTGGQKVLVEFPNVTNKIKICNDHSGAGHELEIMFCEPKRAVSFNATNEYYSTTFSSLSELTVSIWVKTGSNVNSQRIIDFTASGNTGIRTTSTGFVRFLVDGNPSSLGPQLTADTWYNFTLVLKDGNSKLILDGQLEASSADPFAGSTGFEIGDSVGTFSLDGTYDEIALFSSALTDQEVQSLWNNGAMIQATHSSLISYWAFEDNNYKTFYSSPDTLSLVLDRVSGNNLTLNGSSANVAFVDGRLIENAEARHKITLSGQEQITLSAKCKQIFLHAIGALEVGIDAPLTGIPSNRMFELTGPGIDE
jgi:prepilin-type processing-associated H-X9-DG protein